MLRMPSPPALQTDVAGVRCPPRRRPENYFCGVVGALSPCERRQPFLPCWRAFSPYGAPSPSPSNPPAARRIAECANARPKSARFRYRRFLFGRGAGRAHSPRFPLRRLPSQRGSRSLRSRSPRHAAAEPVIIHRTDVAGGLAHTARGLPAAACGRRGCLPAAPVLSASRRGRNY